MFCSTPLTFLNSPPVCSLSPLDVQLPHQAVAARVSRVPVRVERRIAILVDIPGAPCPATVAACIRDLIEVSPDHQLIV